MNLKSRSFGSCDIELDLELGEVRVTCPYPTRAPEPRPQSFTLGTLEELQTTYLHYRGRAAIDEKARDVAIALEWAGKAWAFAEDPSDV